MKLDPKWLIEMAGKDQTSVAPTGLMEVDYRDKYEKLLAAAKAAQVGYACLLMCSHPADVSGQQMKRKVTIYLTHRTPLLELGS